jgi:hypothetical protein
MDKLHKYRSLTSKIFAVSAILLLVLLSVSSTFKMLIEQNINNLKKTKTELSETFMENTIREQMRRQLYAMRQGWVAYAESHPQERLIKRDNEGLLIYKNIRGQSISFNPRTMYKVEQSDNDYGIFQKNTNKLLITDARPQWDTEAVKTRLGIIAEPIKAFGKTGDVIVFDSFTGEMILDNSEDCKDTPQVLGKDGHRYITLDYRHPNNVNPTACKRIVEKEMMWRHDSEEGTNEVYFFSEPTDMGNSANDFSKYPLGQYKREFQEKIIGFFP